MLRLGDKMFVMDVTIEGWKLLGLLWRSNNDTKSTFIHLVQLTRYECFHGVTCMVVDDGMDLNYEGLWWGTWWMAVVASSGDGTVADGGFNF
ncbi:hypothetical protein RIF29_39277 [Crotalaria pallida]|uniref:Uncharacterized protein n=1 Tax=Crotalaria pallida TaxID=3830 RepID=A0AAN9HMC0_CROPI